MSPERARQLIARSKQMIGKLLWICRDYKANPLRYNSRMPERAGHFLRSNMASLKRIYAEHPKLKPIKVKQLSLFNKGDY